MVDVPSTWGKKAYSMDVWNFYKQFKQESLDRSQIKEVQVAVTTPTRSSRLDRERVQRIVSRFLSAVKRMPKAWNAKPWTSREMQRARDNVENDQFRRKIRREHLNT